MISEKEKSSLFALFEEKGLKKYDGTKFIFSSGLKTSSYQKFLKIVGIPDELDRYSELQSFHFNFLRNKIDTAELLDCVKHFSNLNSGATNYTGLLSLDSGEEASNISEYINSLLPVINVSGRDSNKLLLLDSETNRVVSDVDSEVYMAMKGLNIKTLMANESVQKAFTVFDPFNLNPIFYANSRESGVYGLHVNYYNPPAWRFVDAEPKFEGFIKKLLLHLFPIEEELEYVLDWLHYAVVKRNDTVLCLVGPRGTGKGILLKDIMGQLIGEKYREIVNQEILTDKFNGAFKNRRYIFFDEVNVSGDRELNRFKAFCNSHIALEEKGRDSETIDNYTSLALSSNDKKDFKVEPQERRFSVPQITETPLLKVIPEAEIEAFVDRISKPDSIEIAEFGQFLLKRRPKNSSRTPLRGRYYFDLCKLSMPEWKNFIIEFLINEGEAGVVKKNNEIQKHFRKVHGDDLPYATRRGSVETFISDYYHEGVCRIGKIVDCWDQTRSRSTFGIMPNEEFIEKFGKFVKEEDNLEDLL